MAFANLGVEDGVCGYAFFFDEFLDLDDPKSIPRPVRERAHLILRDSGSPLRDH